MSKESTPLATAVENQVLRVQIPAGLKGGDSFVVSPPTGKPFTVIVPEGVVAGSYIQVLVPDLGNINDVEEVDGGGCAPIKMTKATAGAVVLGAAVGTVVLGPFGGIALAGAAAYATTRKEGKIGETSRKLGKSTYNGIAGVKNWVEKKITVSD